MGVGGISNTDNANPRQLKWEMDRDDNFGGKSSWKKKNKQGKSFNKKSKKPNPVKKRVGGAKKPNIKKKK